MDSVFDLKEMETQQLSLSFLSLVVASAGLRPSSSRAESPLRQRFVLIDRVVFWLLLSGLNRALIGLAFSGLGPGSGLAESELRLRFVSTNRVIRWLLLISLKVALIGYTVSCTLTTVRICSGVGA